jgi:hypothetical protein
MAADKRGTSMTEPIHPEYVENTQMPAQHPASLTALNEDRALAQLKQRNSPIDAVEEIARNSGLMKSRKVRMLLAAHPHAPRRLALRLIREFYTFDLMHFALGPGTPVDLRRFADELLISRVASITLGECISLARRSSEKVAGALLLHPQGVVWQAALQNPRLTERAIIKALSRTAATPSFVEFLSRHPKWTSRAEIRLALLGNSHTPLARAVEFARGLSAAKLRDVLHSSRLPEGIKELLRQSGSSQTNAADDPKELP